VVVKRHVRAFVREREPDRTPEALPGAGHQHDVIAQPEIHECRGETYSIVRGCASKRPLSTP
jgi:hypothetical protein